MNLLVLWRKKSKPLGTVKEWQQALQLFSSMAAAQVTPDVVTRKALINVCRKADQWQHAMSFLEPMPKLERPGGRTYKKNLLYISIHARLVHTHIYIYISARIITTSPDVTPEIDLSHWIKDTKGFKVSSFTRKHGEKHG